MEEKEINEFKQSFPGAEVQVLGNPTQAVQVPTPTLQKQPPRHKNTRRSGRRPYNGRLKGKLHNHR